MQKPVRYLVIAAIALLAAFELWSLLHARRSRASDSVVSINPTPAPAIASPSPSHAVPAVISRATPAPTTPPFAPPDEAALRDVDKVSLMIRDYHTIAGENPVGTNAEIMAAVMGGNPRQATLGPPEGMSLNEKGELIDRWGTPYFFHQLSRDQIEIRSAGPDKIMWTDDDPVIR